MRDSLTLSIPLLLGAGPTAAAPRVPLTRPGHSAPAAPPSPRPFPGLAPATVAPDTAVMVAVTARAS